MTLKTSQCKRKTEVLETKQMNFLYFLYIKLRDITVK